MCSVRAARCHRIRATSHSCVNIFGAHPVDSPVAVSGGFLARSSVGTRMIANQAEFDATLAAEGFISRDMADLSIAEQRELLSDAEVLVGAMGTNLLALYFAPPGCRVMVVIDDVELDIVIAQTCAMVGQSCEYLISTPARASNRAMHSRDLDFEVDCAAFRERLRERA